MVNPAGRWITVAQAAALMELGKRGALKRLTRLNARLDGRLLRSLGDKRMPGGVQPSKWLVSLDVLRESMQPDLELDARELTDLRAEVELIRAELEFLAKAQRKLRRRLDVVTSQNAH